MEIDLALALAFMLLEAFLTVVGTVVVFRFTDVSLIGRRLDALEARADQTDQNFMAVVGKLEEWEDD